MFLRRSTKEVNMLCPRFVVDATENSKEGGVAAEVCSSQTGLWFCTLLRDVYARILVRTYSFLFPFFHPIGYLRPSFFSLLLIVVTQIRGHIAGSSSPSTLWPAFLSREDFSSFFPRRLALNCVLTHARHSQQLLILFIFANTFKNLKWPCHPLLLFVGENMQ